VAALEIMLDTPRIKDLIKRGESDVVKDAMEQSAVEGCQTFDGALHALVAAGRVSQAEALRAADSPNNLRLMLERLAGAGDPAEMPLRLVSPPEQQIRRQTVKIQAQQGVPAPPPKNATAIPAAGDRLKR
jgi:hypothetical protein